MGLVRQIGAVSAFIMVVLTVGGQATQLGTQTVNGGYASYGLTDLGIFRQARVQATSSSGAGVRNWEFYEAPFDYDPAWRPYSAGLTLAAYDQTISPAGGTASALFNTAFGGSAGLMPAVISGNYYTFNVTEYSTPGVPQNEFMGVLQTPYAPVSITSVSQSPVAGAVYPENSVYVTVNTSAPLSADEYMYLRYSTTFNFLTSSLLQVTMTGTTGTVEIPCQTAGTNIYYYVYSSNRTSAEILADEGVYGQVVHDMSTLSINNNGGPNFTYTVLPSIGFCGDYYVPSVCYPTIASFVTALNAGTVSCDVVCRVAAGHSETAPAGGIILTQTGTAANTITFIKNGIGANPVIYAPVGTISITASSTTSDGIFSLNGSDYITIDAIDVTDNNVSGAAMMEYGYGLFKNSGTNGCQNNIIRNCYITLNNANFWTGAPLNFEFGSTGIMMRNTTRTTITTLITVTSAAGRSDGNQFYGNTISNMINGFVLAGYNDGVSPYVYMDQNNSVGIAGTGNVIINYGNVAGTARASGVYTIYQNELTVTDNFINNYQIGGVAHNNTLYGIFVSSAVTGSFGQNITVTDNYVTLLRNTGSLPLTAIRVGNPSCGANTVTIDGNTVANCTFTAGSASEFYGIYVGFNATNLSVSNNSIQDNVLNTSTTQPIYLIYNNTTGSNVTVSNNSLTNNQKTVTSTSGVFYGYYSASASATGTQVFSNNIIDGMSMPVTQIGSICAVRITSSVNQTKLIYANSISNITSGTGFAVYATGMLVDGMPVGSAIYDNSVSAMSGGASISGFNLCSAANYGVTSNVGYAFYNNSASDISSTSATTGSIGVAVYALTSGAENIDIYNNDFSNLYSSATSSGYVHGISVSGGTSGKQINIYDNRVNNLYHTVFAGNATVRGITGFLSSPIVNIYNNDVHDLSGNGTTGTSFGIDVDCACTVNIFNNFVQRLTAPASASNVAVNGITVVGTGVVFNVLYNTVVLGYDSPLTSSGSGFGFAGLRYSNTATPFNNMNNIIYVNGTATGTGLGACVKRFLGTAYVQPANFLASNNNYYYINNATWNYIYTEGLLNTTNVNGYAYGGAFTNVSRNLNNDECFNIIGAGTGLYKTFMAPAESISFYDVPPFAGGATYPDNIKLTPGAVTYAESNAQAIPGILTDFEGDIRSGTTPDIGADEGAFVVQFEDCYLLPLELLEFTGWNSGAYNELHWITSAELNTSHFVVERSADGVDFYQIGLVAAAGFSDVPVPYTFIDDEPLAGMNYYRLRMVDTDAAEEYSNIILIMLDGDTENGLTVYPNPATDQVTATIHAAGEQPVLISLLNMLGQTISGEHIIAKKGINVHVFDLSNLPSAGYLVQITWLQTGMVTGAKLVKY